jgi:hypothetical protein
VKQRIKLWADYGSYPLWGVDEVDNFAPEELPLSSETIADLHQWQDSYDATLNQDYPPLSGFSSAEVEANFKQEGVQLWKQLRQELSAEYEVYYQINGQLFKHPSELDLSKAIAY